VKHSKGRGALAGQSPQLLPATLEGQLVRLSDIIAYVNHDLDDAIRGGLINRSDVPLALRKALGEHSSQRLNTMIIDLIETTLANKYVTVELSSAVAGHVAELRDWLHAHVYRAAAVEDEFRKASRVLKELFLYFVANPEELSAYGGVRKDDDPVEVAVTDFLAGMTDRYAMNLYQRLFFPQPWKPL